MLCFTLSSYFDDINYQYQILSIQSKAERLFLDEPKPMWLCDGYIIMIVRYDLLTAKAC